MTSEDPAEDPLMSVQIYFKSDVFIFRVAVHLLHFTIGDETVNRYLKILFHFLFKRR